MVKELKEWYNVELSNLRNMYNVIPMDLLNIVLYRFTPLEINRKAIELGLTTPDSLKLSATDVSMIHDAYKSSFSPYMFFATLSRFTSRQVLRYLSDNYELQTDFSTFLNDFSLPPYEVMRNSLEAEAFSGSSTLTKGVDMEKEGIITDMIAVGGKIDFSTLLKTYPTTTYMTLIRYFYQVITENRIKVSPVWVTDPEEYEAISKNIDFVFDAPIINPVVAEKSAEAKELYEKKEKKKKVVAEAAETIVEPVIKETKKKAEKKPAEKKNKRKPKAVEAKNNNTKIDIFMPVKRWKYEELDIIVSYCSFMRAEDLEKLLPRWCIKEIEEKWEQLCSMGIIDKEALDLYLKED